MEGERGEMTSLDPDDVRGMQTLNIPPKKNKIME